MMIASSTVLDQIVEPVVRNLNTDAAQAILGIRANKAAAKRMAVLARKCDQSALDAKERFEYQTNLYAVPRSIAGQDSDEARSKQDV